MNEKDFIILTDTRQKSEAHINQVFDEAGIMHIQTKLDSADYMAVRYDEKRGFYKDYTILIDTKKDLLEMCNNICGSHKGKDGKKMRNHERLVNEVNLGHELGCTDFIFLIGEKNIKSANDIKNWWNKNTIVKGETLYKAMRTFKEHHNCRFIFVPKKNMGQKVIDLLNKK